MLGTAGGLRFSWLSLFFLFTIPGAWAAPCALNPTSPSVTICTPANGATVTSPVHIVAGTTDTTATVTAMAIYVDNVLATKQNVSQIDASVAMSVGSHYVVVQAWDSAGRIVKTPENITVTSTSSSDVPFGYLESNKGTTNTNTVPQNTNVLVSGWAADKVDGAPVAQVVVYIDNVSYGNATLGYSRPDIATAYNDTRYTNSGWKKAFNIGNLAPGTHTVKAVAYNKAGVSAQLQVSSGAGSITVPSTMAKIKHIIFVAQENRSFDTYFGKLNEYRAALGLPGNVDGLPANCSSTNSNWSTPCGAMNKAPDANGYPTTPIYAFHLKTMCIENTSADWIVSHWDFNAGNPASNTPTMDGYVISAASAAISTGTSDTKGIRAMGFYNGTDLAYPYWLATQFATSDRWFSPAPARTQPSRYFMVGATSGGQAYPSGVPIKQKTIFDLLTMAGVSWKIYSTNGNTSATAFTGFVANGHIVPYSQFVTDAKNGTLPAVAYIEKPDADEHPGIGVNIQNGVNAVRDLVNAVMYGPSWKDSVMIVTFDESGGLYDHVPPPTNVPNPDGIKPVDLCTSSSDPNCSVASRSHGAPPYDPAGDFTRTGFRVPLMLVSPFAKAHYVSHTVTDYTSWMKLVETRFGLPHLNARDAWASDMTEYFDFTNVPWASPPQNPPAVNYGQCYDSLP
jgi:phospholipase C